MQLLEHDLNELQRKLELNHNTILDNGRCASLVLFHPYEPLLFAADDRDGVSAFNFEEAVRCEMGRGSVNTKGFHAFFV